VSDAPTRGEAERRYATWERDLCSDIRVAFGDLTSAMCNWHAEICNYFDRRYTNAATESLNAVARAMDRPCRGLSFESPTFGAHRCTSFPLHSCYPV